MEQQVCFALAVAARSVVALYRPLLEPMGLTHPQYLVMLALWQHAPLSVRALSACSSSTPARCRRCSSASSRSDTCVASATRADERSLAVTLTAAGRALRQQAERIPPAVVERLGLPIDDLQRLHAALTRVIAAAKP